MTDDSTTSVRMYNVGFGDAFLVTVHRSNRVWRMPVSYTHLTLPTNREV